MWPTEEAKAGAFAYAAYQGGKGWSLRLRGPPRRQRLELSLTWPAKDAKAGAFAYVSSLTGLPRTKTKLRDENTN